MSLTAVDARAALVLAMSLVAAFAACGGARGADDAAAVTPPRARYGTLDSLGYSVETQDWNLDGVSDTFIYSDAGGPAWSERDFDFDGRTDFYEYYGHGGVVVEREFQLDFDDAIDAVHVFSDGVLVRKEFSTGFDSTPSMFKYYDSRGNPLRTERDRDGDGIIDHVYYYEGGQIVRVGVDTNGDGSPDDIEAYD